MQTHSVLSEIYKKYSCEFTFVVKFIIPDFDAENLDIEHFVDSEQNGRHDIDYYQYMLTIPTEEAKSKFVHFIETILNYLSVRKRITIISKDIDTETFQVKVKAITFHPDKDYARSLFKILYRGDMSDEAIVCDSYCVAEENNIYFNKHSGDVLFDIMDD
jgi:hypothetical protein